MDSEAIRIERDHQLIWLTPESYEKYDIADLSSENVVPKGFTLRDASVEARLNGEFHQHLIVVDNKEDVKGVIALQFHNYGDNVLNLLFHYEIKHSALRWVLKNVEKLMMDVSSYFNTKLTVDYNSISDSGKRIIRLLAPKIKDYVIVMKDSKLIPNEFLEHI